ncbi:MAG: hypothetical protein H7281_11405 [Bacteriovorax sp.]|nr:hypothetical protein [Bacteriovorax sp.]
MKQLFLSILFLVQISTQAFASPTVEDLNYYRQLTQAIRTQAQFKVSLINQDEFYDYSLELGEPVYNEPIVSDLPVMDQSDKFYRNFWDRIYLKDGSRVVINGEEVPLTCIFVSGQDNRYSGLTDPRFPQFIMKIYLVANDFTCVGPKNPGWPNNGAKEETWDTYLYYEVKDPTIMLPVEAKIRVKWNEFKSVLVK